MICLCTNSTSWDSETGLIPGGQGDRYLTPILEHLPGARIVRQPEPGAINAYTNHWGIYRTGAWRYDRLSVQLSHGIADKGYRSAAKARGYDYVAFPGPALADLAIASGLKPAKVKILGYPKLDPLFRGEVTSPWPERDGRVRVLWAPTHGGGSERWTEGNQRAPGAGATTWWRRDDLLPLLDPERFHVMEAPHPRHHPRRQATLAEYVGADVVIADGGSTMYEAWTLGLPVVFADWLTARRNLTRDGGTLLEHQVYAQAIGWHASTPGDLPDLVATAAKHGITVEERGFAHRVLPQDLRGHGGRLHAEFLTFLEASGESRRTPSSRRRPARA